MNARDDQWDRIIAELAEVNEALAAIKPRRVLSHGCMVDRFTEQELAERRRLLQRNKELSGALALLGRTA